MEQEGAYETISYADGVYHMYYQYNYDAGTGETVASDAASVPADSSASSAATTSEAASAPADSAASSASTTSEAASVPAASASSAS